MAKIKEDLKEKLMRGLKKIPEKILSSDELTEVSGGDGVKEFVVSAGPIMRRGREVGIDCMDPEDLPDDSVNVKLEVKDGVLTVSVSKELSGTDILKICEAEGIECN